MILRTVVLIRSSISFSNPIWGLAEEEEETSQEANRISLLFSYLVNDEISQQHLIEKKSTNLTGIIQGKQ